MATTADVTVNATVVLVTGAKPKVTVTVVGSSTSCELSYLFGEAESRKFRDVALPARRTKPVTLGWEVALRCTFFLKLGCYYLSSIPPPYTIETLPRSF